MAQILCKLIEYMHRTELLEIYKAFPVAIVYTYNLQKQKQTNKKSTPKYRNVTQ